MKIVILSRNSRLYSTQRLAEAATKRGHSAEVIDPLKCTIITEKKNPMIVYKGRRLDNIDAVIPRVGASVTFYGAAVVRQFEMMKVFTAVESQALMRSRDKLRCLQILSRAGLGMPKTVFTNYSKDIDEIIKHVGGVPLIIKLLEGTQGLGVMLAENKNAASSIIETFHDLKARIIAQEYIREARGADIRAFVIDGEVVGAMKRQAKPGEFRSNLHRGAEAQLIKLSYLERKTAVKAAKKIGLAIAGVDMLQSSRGPLILEVNSSPGLQGIESATKIDIAGKIIEFIEKNAKGKKIQKDKVNA